jgi:hypothetical protein
MPRQLRIQYPGAMYHVMSRGNRGQDIFLDVVDPTPDYENVLTD